MIRIKRILISLLCLVLAFTTCACTGSGNALKLFAADGEVFATIKSDRAVKKNPNRAYIEIAVNEAAKIVADLQGMDEKQAKKALYQGGYTVYTAFDRQMNQALAKACSPSDELEVGAAITDLQANLVAVYSTDWGKKGENLATRAGPPCSAFKPLSVYAPALDSGVINWASRYEDSAYKYIKNLEGVMRPWPKNATNVYTKRYVYIHQALKESLNTTAVKCLADYGVNRSIAFLERNFAIDLAAEKKLSGTSGQDEVIGNIALGSLVEGVSAVDMAGYYQIFANGGQYREPKAVFKICDAAGKEIYNRKTTPRQIVKQTTAEIMNRMLREVVSPGGTGEKAACTKVEVAGKTGTDESGENNWFVGVTPEYSCAVWHGISTKNMAPSIFSKAIDAIYREKQNPQKTFMYRSGLAEIAYCTDTGKQFSAKCPQIYMGYFTQQHIPGLCDRHQ